MLALVKFEKGSRLFRGSEIGSGIEKCHQVINMNGKKTLYIITRQFLHLLDQVESISQLN